MTAMQAFLLILLCTIAGSYTWGMRGTIIGAERGAVLPGAVLGLLLAFGGGVQPMSVLFPVFATVGGCAMFFGGDETYGETIGLSLKKEKKAQWHGRIGLAVKGGNWFGIFAGMLAFALGAMAGRYSLRQIVLFVVLIPVVKALGYFVINSFSNPPESKIPALYFSVNRKEAWASNTFVCLYLLVFSIFVHEWFTFIMTLTGFVWGAIGFFVGNIFQYLTHEHYEGKAILGKFQKSGFVESWKFMECTFGAIGGLGVSLTWSLCFNRFVSRYAHEITAHSGIWNLFRDKPYNIHTFVWLILIVVYLACYVIFDREKDSKHEKILNGYEDGMVWVVYCLVPLFLALTGNVLSCNIYSLFVVPFLLADKILFGDERLYKNTGKSGIVLKCILVVAPVALLALTLFTNIMPSAYIVFLIYIVFYLLVTLFAYINPTSVQRMKQENGTFRKGILALRPTISWLAYATICTIVLSAVSIFYF